MSFYVTNLKGDSKETFKKNLTDLAVQYRQDNFIFKPAGHKAKLVQGLSGMKVKQGNSPNKSHKKEGRVKYNKTGLAFKKKGDKDKSYGYSRYKNHPFAYDLNFDPMYENENE